MASGEDYLDSLLKALDGDDVQGEEENNIKSEEKTVSDDFVSETESAESYDDDGEDMDFPELAKLFEEEKSEEPEPEETADVPAAAFNAEITEEGPELQEAQTMAVSDREALMTPDLPDDTSEKADQETDLLENADVTDLIDALDDDDDLAEIGELLKKSDYNEAVNDGELPPDEKSVGEKEEQEDSVGVSEAALEDTASGKKKEKKKKDPSQKGKGLLQRIISFFTEEDEDEEDEVIEEGKEHIDLSQENVAILEELDKEKAKPGKKPKKEKPPKPKKEKKPKPKKEKKPKPKKEKKKPKPKKEKKPKAPKEPEKPLKPIGAKRIVTTIFFALTVFGMIMLFTMYIPNYMDRQSGREAFHAGDYRTAYDLFVTKSVKGQDEAILKGSKLCLEIDRKLESYENYRKLEGMEVERLHALIGGVDKYWKIKAEAEQYGVAGYVNNGYLNILSILQAEYGVSEEEARGLTEITDSVTYTKELKRILGLDTPAVSEEAVSEE